MALHGFPFIGIERAVFVQDRFHDPDFSNVMQHAAEAHFLDFRAFQANRFGNQDSVAGNLVGMSLSELILGVDGQRERCERIHDDGRQRLEGRLAGGSRHSIGVRAFRGGFRFGERPGELLDAAVDFHKRVGAGGEQALERDAEVGVQDVALPLPGIIRIELIRGGNGVAALMLGKIHRSVGDLNQFLGSGTVQRKCRNAETGRHVFVAQDRIGANPRAQFRGQLVALRRSRFRASG